MQKYLNYPQIFFTPFPIFCSPSLSLSLEIVSRRIKSVKTHLRLIVRKTRRVCEYTESSRPKRQGNGVTLVCTLSWIHRSPFIHRPCGGGTGRKITVCRSLAARQNNPSCGWMLSIASGKGLLHVDTQSLSCDTREEEMQH